MSFLGLRVGTRAYISLSLEPGRQLQNDRPSCTRTAADRLWRRGAADRSTGRSWCLGLHGQRRAGAWGWAARAAVDLDVVAGQAKKGALSEELLLTELARSSRKTDNGRRTLLNDLGSGPSSPTFDQRGVDWGLERPRAGQASALARFEVPASVLSFFLFFCMSVVSDRFVFVYNTGSDRRPRGGRNVLGCYQQ